MLSQSLDSGPGEFQKLKVTAEDVEKAHKNAIDAEKKYQDELTKLREAEGKSK